MTEQHEADRTGCGPTGYAARHVEVHVPITARQAGRRRLRALVTRPTAPALRVCRPGRVAVELAPPPPVGQLGIVLAGLRPTRRGVRLYVAVAAVAAATLGVTGSVVLTQQVRPASAAVLGQSTSAAAPTPTTPTLPEVTPALVVPPPRRPAAPVRVKHAAVATAPSISALAANGIPDVALNAYRVAADRLASADPGCGIDWALIAGIGRVESNHGRFGGAQLESNGTSTIKIIGPALDGIHFPYIADTDHGALDGDPVYDHAIGPTQFIPATWAAYAADGNGDGIEDPFNINDEALATAHYLCVAGGNLRSPAGQTAAVLAYNHSDQYLAEVLALAAAYRSGIRVTGIPVVGAVTGSLPQVTYTAPANPGPAQTGGSAVTTRVVGTPSPAPSPTRSSPVPSSSGVPPSPSSSPTTSAPATPTATPTASPSPSATCVLTVLGVCV